MNLGDKFKQLFVGGSTDPITIKGNMADGRCNAELLHGDETLVNVSALSLKGALLSIESEMNTRLTVSFSLSKPPFLCDLLLEIAGLEEFGELQVFCLTVRPVFQNLVPSIQTWNEVDLVMVNAVNKTVRARHPHTSIQQGLLEVVSFIKQYVKLPKWRDV